MTNKKFRDDLAKEMRDKYNERNEKLEQAEKSSFSSGLKEQMKKEIMDNFDKEMDEMKSRPGYAEAKKTHLEEIKAKIGVNAAKKEKERLQKEYEEMLEKADADIINSKKKYEDAQIARRGEVEELSEDDAENVGELSQEKKEKLYGNREAIIKDLKENYLKEKDTIMMRYRGKEVHLSLPAVGNFEGFKLDYFVSDKAVRKYEFVLYPELEKKLKSMKQIGEILKAVNRYMAELGVKTDGDMDYENDMQYWKTENDRCQAGVCLKDITGLDKGYWTSDKDVNGIKDTQGEWNCLYGACRFDRSNSVDRANLFLGLSD